MKVCRVCGEEKPNTRDYFYRDKRYDDGLIKVCIVCHKKRTRKNYFKRKKINERKRRKIKEANMSIHDLLAKDLEDDRANLLSPEKVENQKWQLNQIYRVKTRKGKDGRKVHSRLGKLVEDYGNLVVFEFETGYKESFLKIDTILDCVQLEEVKRVS